jgi:hypothetical protein
MIRDQLSAEQAPLSASFVQLSVHSEVHLLQKQGKVGTVTLLTRRVGSE